MLSYPYQDERGLYLGTQDRSPCRGTPTNKSWPGIWSAMRNSGSIIGGAINFATNYSNSTAGGIAWFTYLIFVGFGKLDSLRDGVLGDLLTIHDL